ncbi:MAG: 2-C-methyl-D-erythritol 4-phosphate cytidylyltransferase [Bacteroidetes bacterium]|nr:2-C-methyl-D-erythritol 4-phosphate cytidylyltransferase [Bacteroidota bacterium]
MQQNRVAVIVPAAGLGSRMGGTPKQFRMLGNAPLLVQTLRAFAAVEEVGIVVVAVPEKEVNVVEELLAQFGLAVQVVAGGATRQESVGEGLGAVGQTAEVALVHDAVRPFISVQQIREVIAAIHEHSAAAVAVPVADTLRRSADAVFGETVDRESLFRMLTPQGARMDLLLNAHEEAKADGFTTTDEVELLQRAGVNAHLVLGDERNIKITSPSDWAMAEALWPAWQKTEG